MSVCNPAAPAFVVPIVTDPVVGETVRILLGNEVVPMESTSLPPPVSSTPLTRSLLFDSVSETDPGLSGSVGTASSIRFCIGSRIPLPVHGSVDSFMYLDGLMDIT